MRQRAGDAWPCTHAARPLRGDSSWHSTSPAFSTQEIRTGGCGQQNRRLSVHDPKKNSNSDVVDGVVGRCRNCHLPDPDLSVRQLPVWKAVCGAARVRPRQSRRQRAGGKPTGHGTTCQDVRPPGARVNSHAPETTNQGDSTDEMRSTSNTSRIRGRRTQCRTGTLRTQRRGGGFTAEHGKAVRT